MNEITDSGNLSNDKVELISLLTRAAEQLKLHAHRSIKVENYAKRAHSLINNAKFRFDSTKDSGQHAGEAYMNLAPTPDKLEQRLAALFTD